MNHEHLLAAMRFEAAYGDPGPVPRDSHIPASMYREEALNRHLREQAAARNAAYIPGHTRDPVTGHYISREDYVNMKCDAMIDGREPKFVTVFQGIDLTSLERRIQ